jgi:diguanylate cyclase (GGDEF)-like protein/PAS domain S-box-containing protein
MAVRILYVEDNPDDADLTRRGLARVAPDIELDVASTIRDARLRLGAANLIEWGTSVPAKRHSPYEVALMDLKLPDGNGLDLLGQVRAAGLQMAVVMLTGSGDDAAVVTALKAGADDYVVKRGDYVERLPAITTSALKHFRDSEARREQPLRVLYAEHAAVDISKVRRHLSRHMPNLRLEVVHTARQLLNRLPASGPHADYDIVVIDYDLPGINALEVLKELRQARKLAVPALVVTQNGDEDAARQAMTLGAADYLVKGPDFLIRLPIALENAYLRGQLERERHALSESEERFRELTENIQEVFWLTDAELQEVLYVSPAYESIWKSPREALYRDRCAWVERIHEEDRARVLRAATNLSAEGRMDEEYRLVLPDGSIRVVHNRAFPVHDRTGRFYRIAGIAQDITARKEQEARIQYLAYYDELTGLPNRALFIDRLRQALATSDIYGGNVVVLAIDILALRRVNESLGHAAGDLVLRDAARRLKEVLHDEDTLARSGGDEFLVVLPGVQNASQAAQCAERMLGALSKPFAVGGEDLHLNADIGISICPRDGRDTETLVKYAGSALNEAKSQGSNVYCFFSSDMNARVRVRLRLETDLRRAIERHELELHYQPQIDVSTGKIIGVEALLRWHHPVEGLVMPLDFIPIAEDAGLIVSIGEWVLNTAVAQARKWSEGRRPLRMAVNLSRHQLAHPGLIEHVERTLQESGIEPHNLELEITESAVMSDPERAINTLESLHRLGIQLAMDDFGTGYSNLAYLKRFPLDRLKIDASFVQGLPNEKDDVGIVQTIIALAAQLELGVIAEGVETEAQRAFLGAQGCVEQQGYLCSKPLPAEQFSKMLARVAAR